MECFKEVIETLQDFLQEKLYIPYCLYELGESYYTQKKFVEAEEMMKKCSKISGYDWGNERAITRIHNRLPF